MPEPVTARHEQHKCDQAHRLTTLERRIDRVDDAIADGRVSFAEIRKDIQQATHAIAALAEQIRSQSEQRVQARIIDALIFWAVPLLGGAALWAVAKSSQIPGIIP